MNQKKFCGIGCTAVGTIGGVILAPFLGPLAIALPPLLGAFGYKMAEAQGLDGESAFTTKSRVSLLDNFPDYNQNKPIHTDVPERTHPIQLSEMFRIFDEHIATRGSINNTLRAGREVQQISAQPASSHNIVRKSRNAPKLSGARGSFENESYFRRRR